MNELIQISNKLIMHSDHLKDFSLKSLALFGSYARGENREDSDVDILVNLEYNTYRNYSGLKTYLEELLDKKVDLVCENSLNDLIKPQILNEAKWLVS